MGMLRMSATTGKMVKISYLVKANICRQLQVKIIPIFINNYLPTMDSDIFYL